MPAVLLQDSFVNNSVDIQHDRINTLLNETFQQTVRQQIYGEEAEIRFEQMSQEKGKDLLKKKIQDSSSSFGSVERIEECKTVQKQKVTMNRLSLHSLCNEYDLCET